MGRGSIKEDKTIYQKAREDAGLTRAEASEKLEFLSESKIEKIESEKTPPRPEEIMAMARAYNRPGLCRAYCSTECPIGQTTLPEIKTENLSEIVLQMLASLNTLSKEKDRLIEITADGRIDDEELLDFVKLQNHMQDMTLMVDSLKIWMEQMIADGRIDRNRLEEVRRVAGS